jgi:hypothetical protein
MQPPRAVSDNVIPAGDPEVSPSAPQDIPERGVEVTCYELESGNAVVHSARHFQWSPVVA